MKGLLPFHAEHDNVLRATRMRSQLYFRRPPEWRVPKLLPPHTENYMSMKHNLHIKKYFLSKKSAVLRCASRIKIILKKTSFNSV